MEPGQTSDVLVVEDDALLNNVVCRYVQLAGFAARSALNGESALHQAMEHPPCLVLLDLMLPDTSGFDVCEELKRDQRTTAVPVVMVTAMSDNESRQRGMDCGASEYLVKPFDPDQLIEAIKKHAAC